MDMTTTRFLENTWQRLGEYLSTGSKEIELRVIEDKENPCISGYYSNNIVFINFAGIRTLRDFIFVMAHEYRHAWQARYQPELLKDRIHHDTIKNDSTLASYTMQPGEFDANTFALEFEDTLNYKNKVINHTVPKSVFINLKQLMYYGQD